MSPRTEAGSQNPRSRWHEESSKGVRHSWACVPVTDSLQAEAEARAKALEEVRAGVTTMEDWIFVEYAADRPFVPKSAVLALLDRLSKGTDG